MDLAVEHADGRRRRAFFSYGGLALARGAQVVRSRQPLPHDRGLERDHRPAFRQRLCDRGRDAEDVGQAGRAPILVTASEPTTTARSAHFKGSAPPR